MSSIDPKPSQDQDAQIPNPPNDSISSIACNGTSTTPTTALVVGSWDNSVNQSIYQLLYLSNNYFIYIVNIL